MYKVLMYGGTKYSDWFAIEHEMRKLVLKHGCNDLLIISGGAPGADTMAAQAAHSSNVHCAVVSALWTTRHRAAGPQRNEIMVALEPDEAIQFGGDRGSADTWRRLKVAGIPRKKVE